MKSHGVKVFDTLLFDLDQSQITIYIDEINIHHKIRLRDDYRIDSVLYFTEHMTIVALLKNSKKVSGGNKSAEQLEERRQAFKQLKSLSAVEEQMQPGDYIRFSIFDKVKVKVETTTEFPLDIKCTLMFSAEDLEEFN